MLLSDAYKMRLETGADLDTIYTTDTYIVDPEFVDKQKKQFEASIQNGKIYCPICNKIIGFCVGEDGYALCFDCKHSKRILGISSEEIE